MFKNVFFSLVSVVLALSLVLVMVPKRYAKFGKGKGGDTAINDIEHFFVFLDVYFSEAEELNALSIAENYNLDINELEKYSSYTMQSEQEGLVAGIYGKCSGTTYKTLTAQYSAYEIENRIGKEKVSYDFEYYYDKEYNLQHIYNLKQNGTVTDVLFSFYNEKWVDLNSVADGANDDFLKQEMKSSCKDILSFVDIEDVDKYFDRDKDKYILKESESKEFVKEYLKLEGLSVENSSIKCECYVDLSKDIAPEFYLNFECQIIDYYDSTYVLYEYKLKEKSTFKNINNTVGKLDIDKISKIYTFDDIMNYYGEIFK